ncbi:hypothetical protein HY626_04280 [Candidatus Uhrbacteria bacterium]|nr:hypothetical protein [Candidatus Uhrbacteria bacterium]
MKHLNERGQGIAEYAIVVGLVVATIFALGPYVKGRLGRPIQDAADDYLTAAGYGTAETYYADQDSYSASDTVADMATPVQGSVSSDSYSLTHSRNQ